MRRDCNALFVMLIGLYIIWFQVKARVIHYALDDFNPNLLVFTPKNVGPLWSKSVSNGQNPYYNMGINLKAKYLTREQVVFKSNSLEKNA